VNNPFGWFGMSRSDGSVQAVLQIDHDMCSSLRIKAVEHRPPASPPLDPFDDRAIDGAVV